jgi:hypothetical protein
VAAGIPSEAARSSFEAVHKGVAAGTVQAFMAVRSPFLLATDHIP